jgi:hypothetical protein
VDLSRGEISVPQEKIDVLKQSITLTLQLSTVPVRQVASIVGKIIAMGLGIGPVSRFMTRSLYAVVQERVSWCSNVILSPEACDELTFWLSGLED